MKSIFITGGAGYIGTSLIPALLEKGFKVTVYDSLLFNNGDKLIPYIPNKNFTFILGDVLDKEKLRNHIKNHDIVIHLAALVGFPICREKGERESHNINVIGTQNVIDCIDESQYLLFGSTGSNYGEVTSICTEETKLNPLSIYGKTKTEAENRIMERNNSTAFRFATAFGSSPRLRLDLLINDLTYKAMTEGYAVIYESNFMRTFIHVKDIVNVFLFAITNQEQMKNNIYNVGSDNMNFSKKEICELIKKELPYTYFNYADIGEDADKRNYIVSYKKINNLGFNTTVTIEEGIKELIKTIPLIKLNNPYFNILK
jgi:nucleoside-diphosphate-sugar epimerase